MFTPVAVTFPRTRNPDAPACYPCPWPVPLVQEAPPVRTTYSSTDLLRAAQRCAEVAQVHPTWPQSRVRGTVARELNVSTVTLRYLLSKAAALEQGPTPHADAPALAA
ncbi:MAG: hypothetical protein ACRYFX_13970 [Janthinobacterium lividum]